MTWEATTLLRKSNIKIASAITKEIIKNYPMRTENFEKCTRDLRYIITAIEKCIEKDSTYYIDHIIKNFYRGNKLQLQSINVELEAYDLLNDRINKLFLKHKISTEYTTIVNSCITMLKSGLQNGYTDWTYPDNTWIEILENKKQTASWSDKTVDKEIIDSILYEIHQHCNSKQNRVPFEILVMDWSHPQYRQMLFLHAQDQNNDHYNTQVLAPYLFVFFLKDRPGMSHQERIMTGSLEIGLTAQMAALSAVSKGLSVGFCKCFDDNHRKKFEKMFNKNTPVLILGLGYYKDIDMQENPVNKLLYPTSVGTSHLNENIHIKPAMDDYITFMCSE
jgi:hypothetical protein